MSSGRVEPAARAAAADKTTAQSIATAATRWKPTARQIWHTAFFLAVTVALTTLFYLASVHAFDANSDSATALLEGDAIRHGNLALNHWSLSLDSFWTIDSLFYSVGIAVLGIRPALLHLVPAVLAALAVSVGFVFVTRGFDNRARSVAAVVIVVLLALPSHALAYFLLQGPWHVGTTLYCLMAMAILSHGRFGWRWFAAVVLLAAGLLGDLQTLAIGIVPVFLAGVVAVLRCRTLRAGLSTAVAAPAAIVLAVVLRLAAAASGTFRVTESHHTVSGAQLKTNVSNFANWMGALLGVHHGVFGGPVTSRWLEAPRFLAAMAVVVATLVALVRMLGGALRGSDRRAPNADEWRIDDLLLLGLVASVGVFGLLALSNNPDYARYLDPVVIFGALLAARFLAHLSSHVSPKAFAAASMLGLVTFGTSAATLAIDLAAAAPVPPTAALERFLVAHDLHNGIGDYWSSSIVAVDTADRVRIRPVVANLKGIIVADGRSATSVWYRGIKFAFLVYEEKPYGRVEPKTIVRRFGTPVDTYRIGQYSVDVWGHPLSLGPETFP